MIKVDFTDGDLSALFRQMSIQSKPGHVVDLTFALHRYCGMGRDKSAVLPKNHSEMLFEKIG
jgi:hypothetical protein